MSSDQLPAHAEVVVVGAGPTGLALACALAARGVDVVIVDRAATHRCTSRATVVHARTLDVLETIDATQPLLERGLAVSLFTISDRDRTLLQVPFEGLPTAHPYALACPQNVTEDILEDRLIALGGRVHHGYEAVGIDNEADGAAVTLVAGGATRRVRAGYLVGCDGMHSTVRQHTGIAFVGDRYPESFVLADVRMGWPLPRDGLRVFFSSAGPLVVVPLPDDQFRIVATADEAPDTPTIADVQAVLDARGPARRPAHVDDLVWSSRFRVHHRLAERYRHGRVFLAGDAAHVHSPAGGQGMNTGIQDGIALATALVDVIDERADEAHLDTYEAARRPIALGVIAATDRLTRIATARGQLARAVRNTAVSMVGHLPPARRRIAMALSQLPSRPDGPHIGAGDATATAVQP